MNKKTDHTKMQQTLEIVRNEGILRARDLDRYQIPRVYLSRLQDQGKIEKLGRGLYMVADAPLTENHSLAEVAKRVPRGVICLISALAFHGITTQIPYQVWMAIDVKAHKPASGYPPLRVVRFSGESLTAGIETHMIEGVSVPIYGSAKTVTDCFKFRNKIGLDVALEALRDCWRERRCTMQELWRYAEICRVANVMSPYLDSLV